MAGYVSLQDVTKTYKMGEVTIKAADGISFDVTARKSANTEARS